MFDVCISQAFPWCEVAASSTLGSGLSALWINYIVPDQEMTVKRSDRYNTTGRTVLYTSDLRCTH